MALTRIFCICDHGTAGHKEDGLICNRPFYVVIDGFSEPHSPQKPPVSFDGMTGGEMIVGVAEETLSDINPVSSLEECISQINGKIHDNLIRYGLPQENAGRIPGAAFIFLKIEKEAVRLVQGGDCLAVWLFKSGEIGYTINQAFGHVAGNLRIIREILERNGGNREEMWIENLPVLSERRQRDINNPLSKDGYAALNGQSAIQKCWQFLSVPVKDLKIMLIFSDGFISYSKTSNERIAGLAAKLMEDYQGGLTLEEMLKAKRKEEMGDAKTSYITHDEATALALEFDDFDPVEETLYLLKVKGNFFYFNILK